MNKYIKTNINNEIIDVFFEYQNKKDGSEILLGDYPIKHKIEDNSISNEYGVFIYTWSGEEAIMKSAVEIDDDPDFIVRYKQHKKDEIQQYIGSHLLDIISADRTLQDVVAQWNSFKSNAGDWTTKAEIDKAFDNAISWLTS